MCVNANKRYQLRIKSIYLNLLKKVLDMVYIVVYPPADFIYMSGSVQGVGVYTVCIYLIPIHIVIFANDTNTFSIFILISLS